MTMNNLPPGDPAQFLDELMRRDFGPFLQKAFTATQGGGELSYNWHIDAIAKSLEDVAAGRSTRLLVTMPPRNLKSFMISVAWVAWMLGRDPTRKFVCVSYSNELSAKFARDCRSIIESQWYRRLFPATRISNRSASHDFETTRGGGRLATSISGTLTGRGGDIIIIDDPLKPDDAMSDTARKAVNNWFRSTLSSRLDDKGSGAIITVMQRLHEDDLAGILIEEGGWEHLCLPAIALADTEIPLTRGRTHKRLEGELLHPEREPQAVLDKLKSGLGSANFEAQYQQQPVPAEGNMVKVEWLRHYPGVFVAERGDQIIQSWDTASKEGVQNDWSVCVTAAKRQGVVYLIDIWRKKVAFPDLKKAVIRLAQNYKADVLLIEDAASGMQLNQMLREEEVVGVPRPIAIKPEGDKKTRLAAQAAPIEAGTLVLPAEAPWRASFEHELLGFPNARHDDQVDALSQLLAWAGRHSYDDCPAIGGYLMDANGIVGTDWFNADDPDRSRDGDDSEEPDYMGILGP